MTVLFMTRKFPPSVGGMELFAYQLNQALKQTVTVKTVKWGGANWALPVVLPYLWLAGLWQILRGGIDAIHAQDAILAPQCWLLAKLTRKPFVLVVHGLDITYPNRFYQAVILWFVRRADVVCCNSHATAEEATKRGVDAAKIQVIPLGIDDTLHGISNRAELLQLLDLADNTDILLTVGRLVKRKGVAWFIEQVLPTLVMSHPAICYLIVGEGGQKSEIEAAVARSSMSKHVRLLGRLDSPFYEAVYNGADVFVMPNVAVTGDIEGFGLVALEASLCALPIVASNLEGIADAIQNGKNGVLVPAQDTLAFQQAMSRFLDDKAAAQTFGKQSRAFTLEHYQWSRVAQAYVNVYTRLLKV